MTGRVTSHTDALDYYSQPGVMTHVHGHEDLLRALPGEIDHLCQAVQGVLLHVFWAERMGVVLREKRMGEVQLRSCDEMLRRLRDLSSQPLTEPRRPELRLVGNCRHFSVLLCGLLRYLGQPARVRSGFATYFDPGHYEDHWICEVWREEQRWTAVDAQLDGLQRQTLQIEFNPHDVPGDRFLPAGRAWQMCRTAQADPLSFGIFDMRGLWFIRGNIVRDLAALNKMELLPWDGWGLIDVTDDQLSEDDWLLLDRVASTTTVGSFDDMRGLYEAEPRLRVPPVIQSYTAVGTQEIRLDLGNAVP